LPEPFKNFFNPTMIAEMGVHLSARDSKFDADGFTQLATDGLEALELKQRSNHILTALEHTLPGDFESACNLLVSALHPEDGVDLSGQTMDDLGIRGWAVMPMADYVAWHGLEQFDFSMNALKEMTKRSSSEFAVRPFLASDPQRAMRHVVEWAKDKNYHVRRLASEGTRPRLPWGMRLAMFVTDPDPVLPVLDALKDDPEEYVRRSVANNLNDIAKDHPDLVGRIAGDWLAGNSDDKRRKLVRHACRSLIKRGHPATLEVFGYRLPRVSLESLELDTNSVRFGQNLHICAELQSDTEDAQELVIDYVVHHRKANGKTSPKVFKWKNLRLAGREKTRIEKKHAFKPITTRTYHGGAHAVEIQVNGQCLGRAEFELVL
jgi:3-methyladenine DNA glycosylase AlkC